MKNFITALFLFVFSCCGTYAQTAGTTFEKCGSFYPEMDQSTLQDIEWGLFTVPENWNNTKGKTIKLAVALLKNKAHKKNSDPVLVMEGGPGAGAIEGIWFWINHPVRENRDIILVDTRGTGFSTPRLCPDLGKEFLKILAKNQNEAQDEKEKVMAAMACQQNLIANNIDINAYNSKNIARDLNALKIQLNYKYWNVVAVSYGTYMAQVYASDFPEDVKTMILDSPISDIKQYYTKNTSNYMSSLGKVFEACKKDSLCNKEYPDLERIYYKTIMQLSKKPLEVKVDKSIIETGHFTYNVEDFKIVIQQSLYQKQLISVLPLLIYQFYNGNKETLGSLVSAFSGILNLDYGLYYCVSCKEVIPENSYSEYNEDANQYKALHGGLSFYKTDFTVCDKWNGTVMDRHNDLPELAGLNIPILIFTGGFDPITPASNGKYLNTYLKNTYLVNRTSYGHASSFSITGSKAVNEFIDNPKKSPNLQNLQSSDKISFVTNINVNKGVSKFGNSINNFNVLFFSPLIIALLISFVNILFFVVFLIRKKNSVPPDKLMKVLTVSSSALGIALIVGFVLALNNVASSNFYILAFGLPKDYNYLFNTLLVFGGILLITLAYFFINIKSITDRSIIFSVLFSNLLIGVYFYYWGFF